MNLGLHLLTSKYVTPIIAGVIYYIANRYSFLGEESNPDIEPIHIAVIALLVYIAMEVSVYFSRISKPQISLKPMD